MAILREHGSALQRDSMIHQESLRSLVRAVTTHEKDIMRMCDENQFSLTFLQQQLEQAAAELQNNASTETHVGAILDDVATNESSTLIGYGIETTGKQPKKKQKKSKKSSSIVE